MSDWQVRTAEAVEGVEAEMGEPVGVNEGDTVWVQDTVARVREGGAVTCSFSDDDYGEAWTQTEAGDYLPDHPALPAVAAELARQGDGAVAVVLSPEAFESLIGSAEAWQEVFDRERENDLVSDAISSARAQLFSQRGDDEA